MGTSQSTIDKLHDADCYDDGNHELYKLTS
jgi:hypothetical protein